MLESPLDLTLALSLLSLTLVAVLYSRDCFVNAGGRRGILRFLPSTATWAALVTTTVFHILVADYASRAARNALARYVPVYPGSTVRAQRDHIDLGYRRWKIETDASPRDVILFYEDVARCDSWRVKISSRSSPRTVYLERGDITVCLFIDRASSVTRVDYAVFSDRLLRDDRLGVELVEVVARR